MGLFDKVKNMFTEEVEEEEVEEEVKVEQIKKEVTHVPIESPNAKKNEVVKEEENREQKGKNAVFFSDNDFEDLVKPRHTQPQSQNRNDEFFSKEELAKMYGTNSVKEKKEEPKEKVFKPTPIISPVYGILDKNYHKEDIVERKEKENVYRKSPTVTVDTIRNKAYGTLEEQLKDEALYDRNPRKEEVDLFDEIEKENTLVFDEEPKQKKSEDLTMDLTQELDNLLKKKQSIISDMTREERNRQISSRENQDLFNLIDTMYDEGEDK